MLRKLISVSRSVPTVEQWAQRVSKLVPGSPDEIMAAAIAASIANNYDQWHKRGPWKTTCSRYRDDHCSSELVNSGKNIIVRFGITTTPTDLRSYGKEYKSRMRLKGTTVNGIEINPDAANIIYKAWMKVGAKMEAVEKAQSKALSNMKKNEAAWDMVEKLLNLKRNEHGALVPIVTVDDNSTCDDCNSRTKMCTVHQYTEKEKDNAQQQDVEEASISTCGASSGSTADTLITLG